MYCFQPIGENSFFLGFTLFGCKGLPYISKTLVAISQEQMSAETNYIEVNRQSWNNRTDVHLTSEFYDVAGFLKGKISLNAIELNLLGDIIGKDILHLQCHFGQDTISLARLRANAIGVDLSDNSIKQAKALTEQCHVNADFICCDIYDLPNHLDKQFDIVFTSYGTIIWLPDLDKWAKIVARYLKPGGKFVFVDFHPIALMFDDYFQKFSYSYFNTGAIVETEQGTYADTNASIAVQNITWNHPTSEVLNCLINNGLQINSFDEFDYSPYNCFKAMTEAKPGKFRVEHLGNNIPLVFALTATKPAK
jgi:ubiquinone/menaquinone biosynthesis C-methylase UbiE